MRARPREMRGSQIRITKIRNTSTHYASQTLDTAFLATILQTLQFNGSTPWVANVAIAILTMAQGGILADCASEYAELRP